MPCPEGPDVSIVQSVTYLQCLPDESFLPHLTHPCLQDITVQSPGLRSKLRDKLCRVTPATQALRVVMGNRVVTQTKDFREATLAMRKDLPRAATRVTRSECIAHNENASIRGFLACSQDPIRQRMLLLHHMV